jgi:probable rRNA maturation factor
MRLKRVLHPMSESMLDSDEPEEYITIIIESQRWEQVIPDAAAWAQGVVAHVLAAYECEESVAVVLADDVMIQRLNREFRGKDKPTNVLSFPANPDDEMDAGMLGDIILSVETLESEAAEQNKTVMAHASHLLVHGVLHILGYDHEVSEEDAQEMEAEEIALLAELGIANPYE